MSAYAWPARQRRQAAIGPFIDIVLRNNDPAGRVVEANCLANLRGYLHAERAAPGPLAGHRQNDSTDGEPMPGQFFLFNVTGQIDSIIDRSA